MYIFPLSSKATLPGMLAFHKIGCILYPAGRLKRLVEGGGPELYVTASSGDRCIFIGGGSVAAIPDIRVTFHIIPVLVYIQMVGVGSFSPDGNVVWNSLLPRLAT